MILIRQSSFPWPKLFTQQRTKKPLDQTLVFGPVRSGVLAGVRPVDWGMRSGPPFRLAQIGRAVRLKRCAGATRPENQTLCSGPKCIPQIGRPAHCELPKTVTHGTTNRVTMPRPRNIHKFRHVLSVLNEIFKLKKNKNIIASKSETCWGCGFCNLLTTDFHIYDAERDFGWVESDVWQTFRGRQDELMMGKCYSWSMNTQNGVNAPRMSITFSGVAIED